MGPQLITEEEKRPLSAGFETNIEYFRLDFLDPQEIQMGRQFSAILPILWMMAGSRGPRPDAPDAHAPWLLPDGCPFVVLMQETRFKEFVRHVESRSDLTHVFIVTNSQDTVYKLRHEWPELRVVQLYKDYLENFRIVLYRMLMELLYSSHPAAIHLPFPLSLLNPVMILELWAIDLLAPHRVE